MAMGMATFMVMVHGYVYGYGHGYVYGNGACSSCGDGVAMVRG